MRVILQKAEIMEKYSISKTMVKQLVLDGYITKINKLAWTLDEDYFNSLKYKNILSKIEIAEKYSLNRNMVDRLAWDGYITKLSHSKWQLDEEYFKDFDAVAYKEQYFREKRQRISEAVKVTMNKSETKEKHSNSCSVRMLNRTTEEKAEFNRKRYETMKLNNSFGASSLSDLQAKRLKNAGFTVELEKLYPNSHLKCDLYIKEPDQWVELHFTWTHGGRHYDKNCAICEEQLKLYEEKAKTSDYYKNAIYTWTDLDTRKRDLAKSNNLNYFAFYYLEDFNNHFALITGKALPD